MIDKFVASMADAMAGIEDGATVLVGGFGDVGAPAALLDGIAAEGVCDLTVVLTAGGRDGSKIERLLELGRIRKLVCSFVRPASVAGRLFQQGELELEIVPQGTLAERLRAAGAGIEAFYTPTAADTMLAEGRETRVINGRNCLMEYPLRGDVALVDAWQADRWGNLTHRESARNFNPVMAMAAAADHRADPPCRCVGRYSAGQRPYAGRRSCTASCTCRREGEPMADMTFQSAGPRRHRRPHRAGHSGRLVRQPGHRHPDRRVRLRAGRPRGDLSFRERRDRHRPRAAARTRSIRTWSMPARSISRCAPAAPSSTTPTVSPSPAAATSIFACWARSRLPRTATSPTGRARPTSR